MWSCFKIHPSVLPVRETSSPPVNDSNPMGNGHSPSICSSIVIFLAPPPPRPDSVILRLPLALALGCTETISHSLLAACAATAEAASRELFITVAEGHGICLLAWCMPLLGTKVSVDDLSPERPVGSISFYHGPFN